MRQHKRQYTECSTGDNYHDSTAYVYKELNNPGIIYFHKVYKGNVSREQLTIYHHIHHYLSKKTIPILDMVGSHKGVKYKGVKLHILDLDPQDISISFSREDQKAHYTTQPKYIPGDLMEWDTYDPIEDPREIIGSHLQKRLHRQGLFVYTLSISNFRVTGVKNNYVHITVTDLADKIDNRCIQPQHLERINKHIPKRSKKKINTTKELFTTLAQNEKIAKK